MSGFAPASASPHSRRLHAASRPDVARSAHAGLTPFCNAYFYDTKPGRFGCRPRRARIAQVERLIRAQRCIYLRFECACEETRTTRPDALLEAFRSCSTTRWARSRGRLTTWAQSQGASCKFLSGNPGFGRSEPGGQAVGRVQDVWRPRIGRRRARFCTPWEAVSSSGVRIFSAGRRT